MVAFEYLRITEKNGEMFYVAQPNGRPATKFKLTAITPTKVVSENPLNDFPEGISYKLTAPHSLTATISGGMKKQKFRFIRMK